MSMGRELKTAAETGSDSDSGLWSDEDHHHAVLAAGKAVRLLMRIERDGTCDVERESVYGTALALPQIARSCMWPHTFTALVFRNYTLLAISYFCQFSLVYLVFMELLAFGPLGGEMHLCNFGKNFDKCPDAKNCIGPSGEQYTKHNLMSDFGDWQTRVMTRDTLLKLFPDKVAEITANFDPGEYGLESYYCRYLCLGLFLLAASQELMSIGNTMRLLWKVPSGEHTWIDKDSSAVGGVKFRITGMSKGWKVFNFIVIVVPKFFIWLLLFIAGTKVILMSAAIIDTILNSLAVLFITDIDELVLSRLATPATKHIMANLESFQVFKSEDLTNETDEMALDRYKEDAKDPWTMLLLVPRRIIYLAILYMVSIYIYFWSHCQETANGDWISKPIYPPVNVRFNLVSALLDNLNPHMLPKESIPSWSMPNATGL